MNIDSVVMCERPKESHRGQMKETSPAFSALMHLRSGQPGTTTEKLGFTGRGEGIAAQAVASLRGER